MFLKSKFSTIYRVHYSGFFIEIDEVGGLIKSVNHRGISNSQNCVGFALN